MPERIQLRRTTGWRKPPDAIVVARPSKWGNPYSIAETAAVCPHADRAELARMVVSDFRDNIEGRWDRTNDFRPYPTIDEIRAELAGHDLACWCPPGQPCHADVLLELANPHDHEEPPTP